MNIRPINLIKSRPVLQTRHYRYWCYNLLMDIQTQEMDVVVGSDNGSGPTGGLERIYLEAKLCLGMHVTLDPTVPIDVGCAEAASFVLKNSGILSFPLIGFASTNALRSYLVNSVDFIETYKPAPGCVIISPSGTSSKGYAHGHVGIVGNYGIMANDSNSGLFLEHWTVDRWNQYYGQSLGFPVFYYKAVNI